MELKVEGMGPATVVHATGEIDAVTCAGLEETLSGLVEKGAVRIVLDLAGVEYISSAGLRVLLSTLQKVHGKGRFVLCNVNCEVREILEMAGFANIMEFFDDLEKAGKAVLA